MFNVMSRKPEPKWDDPEQSKRFLETAKAVEASDDPNEFERALNNVVSDSAKRRSG
jgi:hypothetical protein